MVGKPEFDLVAPVYDETRRAPSEDELRPLLEEFAGCRTVLDAGVGTGRFAVPLSDRGLEIVGVDLSLGMMSLARAKGIGRLVRANVQHLPVSDRSVDGAFMAHVLQLLPDPRPVLRELGRVARLTVVVLVPEWPSEESEGPWRGIRERYRALAAELGYLLPERQRRYRHTLEELEAIAAPRSVRTVPTSVGVGNGPDGRLGLLRSGQIPMEAHAEILRRLRAEGSIPLDRSKRTRRSRFVAWDPASLRAEG
jgi:ubiquinone/menaquinone biosynthesis C-methylase UbiE